MRSPTINQHQPAFMVITWGCQMNEDDSRQMENILEQLGYRQTTEESDADIILLNTCSVRNKPEQKVLSKLGELRLLKDDKRDLIIGVCGCMAQREGEALLKRVPALDLVLGTAAIYDLPMLIERIKGGKRRIAALDIPEHGASNGSVTSHRVIGDVGLKMFVPVMYGCNNFCTYCVVPSARGPERSRPPEEIVNEVKELVSRGCREVTLVGQNVNSYRGITEGISGALDFAGLLEQLNDIPELERIRFITSHPKDLSDRLIYAIADLPKVCEHLHLPLQSGDDYTLRRMGRKYTAEHYMELVEKLRDSVPGISLTTDLMVGFPGETDEQFRSTLDIMELVRFDAAFMFAFNPRPGTTAGQMGDQVEYSVKTRRLIELIALQQKITLEKNEAMIGRVFEVLVEGPSTKDPSRLTGYTRANKTMNFSAEAETIGRIVNVVAETAHPWGFTGTVVD